ncbi:DNA-binding transcriptional regulator CytR [Pragia fontium]|uniref:Transcriptional regulator, LacI family n=1 Tax=Pragia fontium DSM 5563 = ATCC 49100 TaxID=1122977 RepID=A0AAJ4WD76_9GAMM|nr:DNA-binding transcriptional regulator CytR [Pragia fontium]SFD37264.1 transcriptional regulator, LacI family [Pragia fontium DSM 5563 = ATCC 49100]VEJ56891.1 HTH-type transcriptional repressor CytR [Pragia fontium]
MKQNNTAAQVTMKDVANVAGVSTATVSRALMMPEKVAHQTREKVDNAIQQTGYIPYLPSRNHKNNQSKILLVMSLDITDPFLTDVIQGIQQTAAEYGYMVLLLGNQQQSIEQASLSPLLNQVDGIILLGANSPLDIHHHESLPPMVMANEYLPELKLPTIHIDNLTAAFNAVNYLQQIGHRRIACISGPAHLHLSHYRLQGYIQAIQRSGIALEKRYMLSGSLTFETGSTALTQLMSLPQPPSAIFCHSDIMAIGVIHQAKKIGIKIPEELSIVGFDDIALAQYADPPLTTVAQPRYNIGHQAVLMLLELLQGCPVKSNSVLLDSELIVRESTAKPHS